MFDWKKYEKDTAFYVSKGLRKGQARMNALGDQSSDLYNKATASSFDPFYDDSKIEAFEDWLSATIYGF